MSKFIKVRSESSECLVYINKKHVTCISTAENKGCMVYTVDGHNVHAQETATEVLKLLGEKQYE